MISIKIDFPTGRWHATAWGTHVNEGVPEWPPCSWRLCRALLAAWHWKDRTDETVLESLISKLAGSLPSYGLPEASAAHTRHYMPVIEGKREAKTKIFDTFVHVSEGQSLWIRWDVKLSAGERDLLGRLLESLSYLGRAESLVEASLFEDGPSEQIEWTEPSERSNLGDGEPIRLLAPQSPESYLAWAQSFSESSLDATSKRGRAKRAAALPETLRDALQADTVDWKSDGWDLPPGSRWIDYVRPRDCFKIAPTGRRAKPSRSVSGPTVARFALIGKVQPGITQSLSLAERFHQGLCSRLKDGNGSAITGLDETGRPCVGNQHTYFLPECDEHGYITHMSLHAPRGFSAADTRALSHLPRVWGMEGKGFEIETVLLATGDSEDFRSVSPYFAYSRIWRSFTPFVPVRHSKATRTGIPKLDPKNGLQIGSPEHDCRRLLEILDEDLPILRVSQIGSRIQTGLRDISCLDFQRQRRTGNGTRGDHRGYALEIEFDSPRSLPFGLGYAAHFGLGLFRPVVE